MTTAPDLRLSKNVRAHLTSILPFCTPIPALALGVAAMRHAGVPPGAWRTNIAAGIAGFFLLMIVRRTQTVTSLRTRFAFAAAGIVAILLTFVFPGTDGVHRWLLIGGLRVHASSIAAPLIIVSVAAIARVQWVAATAIAIVATAMLAVQPDAAQATSFSAACAVLLTWCCRPHRPHVLVGVTLLLGTAVISLTRPDPLRPVPHVEGILGLLSNISVSWMAVGAAALLLLPLPFFARFLRCRDSVSLALGVYVALVTLAPLWGTFPVPIMGFGVSPILGYFLALALSHGKPAAERDPNLTKQITHG